jgi:hypothetical protein
MSLVDAMLVCSLIVNAICLFKLSQFKTQKTSTYDARQLLHDLTAGSAHVEIRRIDPNQYFMRSPR